MLYQLWTTGTPEQQQPLYQPVKEFTYCPVVGYFNNWNIVQLSHKSTSSGEIDITNQVVLNGTRYNMAALVKNGKYFAIHRIDTTTMG